MTDHLIERINNLKNEIDALRPIDKEIEGRIQQKFRLDWNYHSNNIEGNSLTFGETKSFLLHGITAAGKPLKDHLDIKGHNDALLMLEDIVKENRAMNETFIRELHKLILNEPYEKEAISPDGKKSMRRIAVGQYKTQPNHVITKTGETFYFAKPEETPALMNDLVDWYNQAISLSQMHPVELAALLHYRFIRIHPFDDGNGRIARILMNLTLMRFGFPPVIIKTQKKEDYYRALQQADGGDTSFFADYIAQLEIDSLELYLRGAKGENITEESDIDKEIELFKAKQPALPVKELTEETWNARLNDSWVPLINFYAEKVNKLSDLFEENTSYLQVNDESHGHTSIDQIILTLQNKLQKPNFPRLLKIHFNLKHRKNLDKMISLPSYLIFELGIKNYQLENHIKGKSIFSNTYDYSKKITQEEITDMVGQTIKALLSEIDQMK